MDIFQEIKQEVTPKQCVIHYLGSPIKKGNTSFWHSPFTQEKTPSFGANDLKGIHDFSNNKHYDIIDFTAKLHGVSTLDAAKLIITDFGLPINTGNEIDTDELKKLRNERNKRLQQQREESELIKNVYEKLCRLYKAFNELSKYIPVGKEDTYQFIRFNRDFMDRHSNLMIERDHEESLEIARNIDQYYQDEWKEFQKYIAMG